MCPSTYRDLAFLFSLGTLPLACGSGDKGSTDGVGTDGTSGATDGGATGAPTSGGPTTTDDDATDTGTSAAHSTTDTGMSDVCEAYADRRIMCDPSLAGMKADLVTACEHERTLTEIVYGLTCLAIQDTFYQCAASASCDEPEPCTVESQAINDCFPEPGIVCEAHAAKQHECYPMYMGTNFAGYCQSEVNFGAYYSGAACGTAIEEWYACLSILSCAELMTGDDCLSESMKIGGSCDF